MKSPILSIAKGFQFVDLIRIRSGLQALNEFVCGIV